MFPVARSSSDGRVAPLLPTGARFFGRFIRLFLTSGVLYALIYLGSRRAYQWLGQATRDVTSESTVFLLSLAFFGVTATLLVLVHLGASFAKIATVREDRRGMLRTMLLGLRLVLRHPVGTGGLVLGIVFFSLGEMLTGPKKNEYLSLIAPPGKKAMYLGYVNIPVGLGVALGSWIAGHVYGAYGEKANLALDHLAANQQIVATAARSMDWSDDLDRVAELGGFERHAAFDLVGRHLGLDGLVLWVALVARLAGERSPRLRFDRRGHRVRLDGERLERPDPCREDQSCGAGCAP